MTGYKDTNQTENTGEPLYPVWLLLAVAFAWFCLGMACGVLPGVTMYIIKTLLQ